MTNQSNSIKPCQPAALYVLSFLEVWDRYSYYGIQAMFILYMSKVFLFSDDKSYALYGVYTALTFAVTVIGGVLADRLIGYHRAIITGAVLIIMANIVMAIDGELSIIYLGLSMMICGIGLLKPNNTSLVGLLYKKADILRDSGFTIFYIGMNAGALLGPIAYGYIAEKYSWHACFITSAIGMLTGLSLLSYFKNKLSVISDIVVLIPKKSRSFNGLFFVGVIIAVLLCMTLLVFNAVFGDLLYVTGIGVLSILIYIAFRSSTTDRNSILALIGLSIFCIFFFVCSLQTATSLTFFIERDVNRHVLGMQIPTMAFLSLQAFFIIIIAPFVAKLWLKLKQYRCEPSVSFKVAIGIALGGISFAVFACSAYSVDGLHKASIVGIVIGNLLLGLGELCVLPAVMSNITRFAPAKLRATLMGIFFLGLAFSGYFAGLFARLTATSHHELALEGISYGQGFMYMGCIAMSVSIVLFLMTPLFKSRLNEHLPPHP